MNTTQKRVLHTVEETAAILRVHPQTIYRRIWSEALGHERHGGKILVSDEHISAYRGKNTHPAKAATAG